MTLRSSWQSSLAQFNSHGCARAELNFRCQRSPQLPHVRPNGNTTSANSNSYGYDFENRRTSLNNGAATFVYDGDGNRVSKTVGSVTTNYLVDTNNQTGYTQVVEELQGGNVTKQFTFGNDLISQRIIGGSSSFYSYDGHGSVHQLTDPNAAITDMDDYDAFGIPLSHTGTTPNDYLYRGAVCESGVPVPELVI